MQFTNKNKMVLVYYALLGVWITTTAMHIPDGYLSPITDLIMFLLVLPFWIRGIQRLRQTVNARNVPTIALFGALCFVIMMFNVPTPGGTTAHAVGGALAAIILGPEVATISISVALLIQALFFGDGGILAFGANCFNMAVVLPYVSYSLYQAAKNKFPKRAKWLVLASGLSGWAGLTVAAFFAGIEFGIQPILFHNPDGTPIYAPYPLSLSLPAMVIPHALVASVVEGVFTALVLAYLIRTNKMILDDSLYHEPAHQRRKWQAYRGYIIALSVLIIATPLGLLAPGTAWGEWGANALKSRGLGFIPQGIETMGSLWAAPMTGYNITGLHNVIVGYILSAALGVFLVGFLAWLFSKIIIYKNREGKSS